MTPPAHPAPALIAPPHTWSTPIRILSRLTLAAAILAGGALLIPAVANAEDHRVSPVGFGELLVGCTSAGGEFGSADWS